VNLQLIALTNLPEIEPGSDLPALLAAATELEANDVLVVAQKIVSKAEGRYADLKSVEVSPRARQLSKRTEKDERIVQLVLDETAEVMRARPGVLIVEDKRGLVCANAGIDRSNVRQTTGETVLLLPEDPDRSAQDLATGIQAITTLRIGIVISDSHGRAWREGTVGVAIGAAGIEALSDRRGQRDRYGYQLQHTLVGVADELAAAASLAMGQGNEGIPAVVIRGLEVSGFGKAKDMQRPHERDLFR
jgi:coenzyme F420-0:L-glutamate ligase / coenzyme F420-1:gamma-L-glutamate ligase